MPDSASQCPSLRGANVLITGGSGFFGQAFARRALDDGACRVVVFSRGEAKQAAMAAAFNDPRLRMMIGDVRDATRIMDACRGIDIVIHAAAQKRVEVCEADPWESVHTNVVGTWNVARACIERGVKKAVVLSTDKAAAPSTTYGSTKLMAERLWVGSNVYSAATPTRFSGVRYGNVAGSTGSVIPTWKAQAAASGEITVTDPAMSRFFMGMDEAVDLVVLALEHMRGGELFLPRCHSATVGDLAKAVAPLAKVNVVGLRPGEKMHETLISSDEARNTYIASGFFIIEPETRTWGDVAPLPYGKVKPDFSLRSDTAPQLTVAQLAEMAA